MTFHARLLCSVSGLFFIVVTLCCRSVCLSVCWSAHPLVMSMYCGKTANAIEMLFGVVNGVDP